MAESFDAYHEWLAISPRDQPPNHYRLLGVDEFEPNANVIENAADRQMAHLRTFQTGKHSGVSQRLLNELAKAKFCLLKSDKKAAYDVKLLEKLAADQAATAPRRGEERRAAAVDGTPPTPDVRVADSPPPVPEQAVVFEPVDDPLRRDRIEDSDSDYFAQLMGGEANPIQTETTDDLSESSWPAAKRVTLRPEDEPDGRIGRETSALPNEPAATSPIADRIRRCPYCGEEILAVAKKCKHCLEFLDGHSQQHQNQTQGTSGCTLIILIALGIVLGVVFLSFL